MVVFSYNDKIAVKIPTSQQKLHVLMCCQLSQKVLMSKWVGMLSSTLESSCLLLLLTPARLDPDGLNMEGRRGEL